MSTDSPADPLASSPEQALVLLPAKTPRSRFYHCPKPDRRARARCNSFQYDGQLLPRWAAEERGRRPCPDCFRTQESGGEEPCQ